LYLKALLRGLYPGPPADWEFRREIERELESVDEDALYERLRQVDPLVASRLHPHDRRRIIRALEVYRLTGRPLGHRQTQFDEARPEHRCRVVALAWPRELLHSRIEARVESMFRAGLVDEVRTLRALHGELGRTASQAVGYREVIEYLRGVRGWGETIEAVKVRTRRFARRQETWFRSLVECRRQLQDRDCWPEATADAIVQQEW
jgi:tRNA dimethylallyltransferase